MKKAKVFAGWLNGTWTQIKAYRKESAVAWFRERSKTQVASDDIKLQKSVQNSGQAPIDEA